MAGKKIDKEFQFTDDSVNCYGFRLLTSGYMMEEFKRNPVGFYMHGETKDWPREMGVLVRWEDFRVEGDKVFAKPVVNLSHPRGQQTVAEIEDGFLNGASVGKIMAIEISEDPALMLPSQTGPTVTKWYNKELSFADIPGNSNSLSLFDKDGNAINLSDFKTTNFMKQLFLTAEMLKSLNLADTSDQASVGVALQNLVAKAAKADTLQAELTTALADKTTAETNLANYKKEAGGKEVNDLLDKALNVDKKITVQLKETLALQYAGKPDELKALLSHMQPYQPITDQLDKDKKSDDKFKNLSYEQLDRAGLLPDLKASNIDLFKSKFKECYGVDYKG